MHRKSVRVGAAARWAKIDDQLRKDFPHLVAWWDDDESFSEIRVKARADGTTLAIAKGFGSKGGPVVCFGVGYGVSAALMAIDSSIQGAAWRVDKPWSPEKK